MPLLIYNAVEKIVGLSRRSPKLVSGFKLRMSPQCPDRNRYTGLLVLVFSKGGYE